MCHFYFNFVVCLDVQIKKTEWALFKMTNFYTDYYNIIIIIIMFF